MSKIDFNQQIVSPLPRLNISKDILSRPGTFPDLNSEMVVSISLLRGKQTYLHQTLKCPIKQMMERLWGVITGNNININLAVHHFPKCSAQQFSLSSSLCRVIPSLATSVEEAGLENFLPKSLLCVDAQQRKPGVLLLLHDHSTKN